MSPPRSNLASANDQGLLKFKNQSNCTILLRILFCIFQRTLTCAFVEMKPFARDHAKVNNYTILNYTKVIYLPDSSHIFKILTNVRSTINVRKGNKNL